MRLTKHRKQILTIFESENDNLLSAEMIFQKLKDQHIDLSTVYRTLEVFFKEELVCRSIMENTAYYYLTSREHHHFMICLNCHRKFKIKCHFEDIIGGKEALGNFKPTHHDLTIYGYCVSCQQK